MVAGATGRCQAGRIQGLGGIGLAVPRVNSALIRRINTARVFHALREHPGVGQRPLTQLTQLDGATVSTILQQLEAEGLVTRTALPRDGRAGRPESLLRINSDAGWLVGVELDSARIRFAAAGMDGVVRERLDMPGSARADHAVRRLKQGVARLLEQCHAAPDRLRGIGIGIPVLIDDAGRLVLAPNLRWRDPAIPARLRALFPAPVQVENVPRAAAWAEHLFGVCRGIDDFVLVHGQSGIGGGLYLRGELYGGTGGLAGELGHMKIVPGGRRCGCGGFGCLEAYVSDRAIRARLAEQGLGFADMAQVAAAAGDPAVLAVVREAGQHLGLGLANLVNLANPRQIVLGGNLVPLARHLLPPAQAALAANALGALRRQSEIIVSRLGEDAVLMGGVAMAMEALLPLPRGLAAGGGHASVSARHAG
jgi:predicted NBD/HSP70 family sugar kinase